MRPILSSVHRSLLELKVHSVNQRLPSGPAVTQRGSLLAMGRGHSVICPPGVICPICAPLEGSTTVNQRFPSGPLVIPKDVLVVLGKGNCVICPAGVMLPI